MNKPQLLTGALALTLGLGAGCNRANTEQQARNAAAEVKQAAARAGDKLADGWLTTKVQARFFTNDAIKPRYIDVSTRDGVVTIGGYVDSDNVRQQVLQIAKNTDGVKDVKDELLIGQSPRNAFSRESETGSVATSGVNATPSANTAAPDDPTITSLIQARYYLDDRMKSRHIDVDSKGGIVTLRGAVASDDERAQALLLARTTQGVQRVEDSLSVDAALTTTGTAPAPAAAAPLPSRSTDVTTTTPPTPAQGSPAAAPAQANRTPAARGGDAIGTAGTQAQDTTVEGALKKTLAADAALKGLQVSVRDGVALVQGTVPDAATKKRALSVVSSTEGVVQDVDRLSVGAKK